MLKSRHLATTSGLTAYGMFPSDAPLVQSPSPPERYVTYRKRHIRPARLRQFAAISSLDLAGQDAPELAAADIHQGRWFSTASSVGPPNNLWRVSALLLVAGVHTATLLVNGERACAGAFMQLMDGRRK
jgi:hypothetical protein